MGTKANVLYESMYTEDGDYEDIPSLSSNKSLKDLDKSVKVNERLTKKQEKAAIKAKKLQEKLETQSKVFGEPISNKLVPCKCNKCGNPVDGTVIAYFYQEFNNANFPFVSYHCDNCGHTGKRSVYEAALPTDKFDAYYFGSTH